MDVSKGVLWDWIGLDYAEGKGGGVRRTTHRSRRLRIKYKPATRPEIRHKIFKRRRSSPPARTYRRTICTSTTTSAITPFPPSSMIPLQTYSNTPPTPHPPPTATPHSCLSDNTPY